MSFPNYVVNRDWSQNPALLNPEIKIFPYEICVWQKCDTGSNKNSSDKKK